MSYRSSLTPEFLDLVPDVILLYDEEGRYRYANEAGADFLGRSVDELIGRTDEVLFPDPAAAVIQHFLQKTLETGETDREVYPLEMLSGETRIWESTWTPVSEEMVGFPGVAGIVRDVTERHHARQAVKRTRKKYEAVFNVNPVALIAIDMDAGQILEVNRGFERIYGHRRDEFEGKRLSAIDVFLDPERMNRIRRRSSPGDQCRWQKILSL